VGRLSDYSKSNTMSDRTDQVEEVAQSNNEVVNGSTEVTQPQERDDNGNGSRQPDFREGCKLFIAQLDFGTQEETLYEAFSKFGKIVEYHISKRGNVSRGFGFVTYDDPRDAEDAMERMNRKVFDGREIKIQIAENRQPGEGIGPERRPNDGPSLEPNHQIDNSHVSRKLFIGNLAWEVTSKLLGETFQALGVGDVEEVRIVMDRLEPLKSRGFGFVTMANVDSAIAARERLHGQDISGRAVKIDFDISDRDGKPPSRRHEGGNHQELYRDGRNDMINHSSYPPSHHHHPSSSSSRSGGYRENDMDRLYRESDEYRGGGQYHGKGSGKGSGKGKGKGKGYRGGYEPRSGGYRDDDRRERVRGEEMAPMRDFGGRSHHQEHRGDGYDEARFDNYNNRDGGGYGGRQDDYRRPPMGRGEHFYHEGPPSDHYRGGSMERDEFRSERGGKGYGKGGGYDHGYRGGGDHQYPRSESYAPPSSLGEYRDDYESRGPRGGGSRGEGRYPITGDSYQGGYPTENRRRYEDRPSQQRPRY